MHSNLETSVVQDLLARLRQFESAAGANLLRQPRAPVVLRPDEATPHLLALLRSDWFVSVVGYFMNHRPSSPYAKLDDEYKVQDLIYCLARTVISDLQYEDPQAKNTGALTSTRVDFRSSESHLYLEIKLATNKHTAKMVEAEISEDIVKYGKQKALSTLVFFVYCHGYTFPNPRQFEKGYTSTYKFDDHQFQTHCVVKP